jgi:hypothetical protein
MPLLRNAAAFVAKEKVPLQLFDSATDKKTVFALFWLSPCPIGSRKKVQS